MLSTLLYWLYQVIRTNHLRKLIIKTIYRLEGGEFYSKSLRKILSNYYDVEIGMYTHGGCFNHGQFDRYTTVGRFCSIARTAYTMNRNHPMENKSSHAFFFNSKLKYCKKDNIPYNPLKIGNDVWFGHNAIILPHVRNIEDGAVIAAGAVVNKDVPPYAVVVGNPARVVRYRFSKEIIEKLLNEKWWEKSMEELEKEFDEFTKPYKDKFSEFDNSAQPGEHD